jgi:hypothetical protein
MTSEGIPGNPGKQSGRNCEERIIFGFPLLGDYRFTCGEGEKKEREHWKLVFAEYLAIVAPPYAGQHWYDSDPEILESLAMYDCEIIDCEINGTLVFFVCARTQFELPSALSASDMQRMMELVAEKLCYDLEGFCLLMQISFAEPRWISISGEFIGS